MAFEGIKNMFSGEHEEESELDNGRKRKITYNADAQQVKEIISRADGSMEKRTTTDPETHASVTEYFDDTGEHVVNRETYNPKENFDLDLEK